MAPYQIFPSELYLLREGDFKFLLVSKTIDQNDSMIIFGDVKTRHFILLLSWMKDNQLKEAYTFGGGKMSVALVFPVIITTLQRIRSREFLKVRLQMMSYSN